MNQQTPERILSALAALTLSAMLGTACSGRSIEDGSSLFGGQGGTSAAGAPSGAGNAGTAGTASGGAASGGAASAGAGNDCGTVNCPAIVCGDGATLVVPPGSCCPVCQSKCSQQTSPQLDCAMGYQLAMQPGQCCPTCVPIPVPECATGEMSYQSVRSQLVDKYASPCSSSADCVAVVPSNLCENGCGYVAITSQALSNLTSNLGSEAMRDCGGCAQQPPPGPPCDAPKPPVCRNGACALDN